VRQKSRSKNKSRQNKPSAKHKESSLKSYRQTWRNLI